MKKILLTLLAAVAFPWAANSWISASKSLSAVDSSLTVVARGYNSVSYQLTGTWSATVKFEGTVSGSNWITVFAVNQNGGSVDSVASANGVYLLSGNGFLSIRARVSARSSGTIVAQATTNEGSGVVSLLNQSSAGASSNVAVTSTVLPPGAATAANQTNAAQKTQIVDGSGNVAGMTSNAVDVNIKSGAASGAVAQGSTTSGQTGGLTQAAVLTAAPTYTTGQTNPLSMTTGGALRVDASAASLTVGTHAVTQSGTWTLQPGNTANTTAWLVTGTGGTFPASQSGTWNDRMQDGSGNALASSATTPGGTEQALITRNIPSGTQAVSGTVTANAGTGTMAVSAAALPLPALAATSTKQSDGSQKTQLVDGSGNVIASTSNNLNVQCANCSGSGVSAADEATFTPGTSLFASGGGLYQVTQTLNPLTTGQQGAFQTTRFRALHVTLRDSTGAVFGNATTPIQVSLANTASNATAVKVDNSAVTQPVSGTVTANAGTGTFATNVSQINGVTPLMGNGVTGTGSPRVTIASDNTAFGVNLAQYTPASGRLPVDPSGVTSPVSLASVPSHAVTNAGTFAVQAGQAAHAASITGNPVRGAGRARTSDYTAVTNDQTADILTTVEGKQVVQPIAIRASTWNYAAPAGGLVNTTGVTAKTAAGAGIRNCVDAAQVINSHQTIGTEIRINDGASGTALWRGWAQFTGGGSAHVFSPPLCGTANTLIEIAEVTATGTAGVLVNLQGHVTQE